MKDAAWRWRSACARAVEAFYRESPRPARTCKNMIVSSEQHASSDQGCSRAGSSIVRRPMGRLMVRVIYGTLNQANTKLRQRGTGLPESSVSRKFVLKTWHYPSMIYELNIFWPSQAHQILIMCFFDQYRFSCGDWKWGHFRQHCARELRIGETCGLKLIMATIPVDHKCRLCEKIDAKMRRRNAEIERIRQRSLETIQSRDADINFSILRIHREPSLAHSWEPSTVDPLPLPFYDRLLNPPSNPSETPRRSPPRRTTGRTASWSTSRPNPYSLNLMYHSKSQPSSPSTSIFLGNHSTDAAEIKLAGESFRNLDNMVKDLYERVDDIAYRCGWQIGGEKFCAGSVGTTLEPVRQLGAGSIGLVDEVRNTTGGYITFVRKKVRVSRQKRSAARELDIIENEISNLRTLIHPHIIKTIGSYREYDQDHGDRIRHSYLLMYPVGDKNLEAFFDDCVQKTSSEEKSALFRAWLKKWFGCLASALSYMHAHNIHHEDIKPKNIVHRTEHIYFTDFSSSRNFEAGQATSTASPAQATRLFAAPEALPTGNDSPARHGSKSDVFSLGLVFVEMLSVLVGLGIDEFHDFLDGHNGFGDSPQQRQYHRVVNLFDDWYPAGIGARMYAMCVKPMLKLERQERPSAEEVVGSIRVHQPWGRTLACPCKDKVPCTVSIVQ